MAIRWMISAAKLGRSALRKERLWKIYFQNFDFTDPNRILILSKKKWKIQIELLSRFLCSNFQTYSDNIQLAMVSLILIRHCVKRYMILFDTGSCFYAYVLNATSPYIEYMQFCVCISTDDCMFFLRFGSRCYFFNCLCTCTVHTALSLLSIVIDLTIYARCVDSFKTITDCCVCWKV